MVTHKHTKKKNTITVAALGLVMCVILTTVSFGAFMMIYNNPNMFQRPHIDNYNSDNPVIDFSTQEELRKTQIIMCVLTGLGVFIFSTHVIEKVERILKLNSEFNKLRGKK